MGSPTHTRLSFLLWLAEVAAVEFIVVAGALAVIDQAQQVYLREPDIQSLWVVAEQA